MGRIETRLDELGLTLPAPIVPPGNYELVKVHAGLAYIAGHGPFDGPTPLVQGIVGRELTLDDGYQAARMTALSMLASLKRELGELDRVTEWIRAVCYVYCEPDFAQTLPSPTASATSSSSCGAMRDVMHVHRQGKAPPR